MDNETNALRMSGICKSFNGVQVLFDVDLTLRQGEIMGLIGENGAGKSTLMKILTGEYQLDNGTIELFGQQASITTPRSALELGIAMVYQELSNTPDMTIAQNMFIGRELRKKSGFADAKRMTEQTAEYLKVLDLNFDPDRKLRTLTVSEMQMVEIAKIVSFQPKIIVFDEPTSSITQAEAEKLFAVIRQLRDMGISIIYISHKLEELLELTDEITVMRDGKVVSCSSTNTMTKDELICRMVGREINNIFPPRNHTFGDVLLEVEHISKKGKFDDVSFSVRAGEILGLSGLVGAGRTETVMALFGDDRPDCGVVRIKGKTAKIKAPKDAIAHGMALLPEDRKLHGLNVIGSVEDNMEAVVEKRVAHLGFLVDRKRRSAAADNMISTLSVKCSGKDQHVLYLSGGNQQKVVLAKWLQTEADIFILDEPTRGVDIGAKFEIYRIIQQLACQGKAIVLISSELNEIIGLCNRVAVMYEGRIVSILEEDQISQERIMSFAHDYKKEGAAL